MAQIVRVKVVARTGRPFASIIQDLKASKAHYNEGSKTWDIAASNRMLEDPERMGLQVVAKGRCKSYVPDQGCPMHGEMCSPAYA